MAEAAPAGRWRGEGTGTGEAEAEAGGAGGLWAPTQPAPACEQMVAHVSSDFTSIVLLLLQGLTVYCGRK